MNLLIQPRRSVNPSFYAIATVLVLSIPLAGEETAPVKPIELSAKSAAIQGQALRFMVLDNVGNLCCWTDAKDWASWEFPVERPGEYVVEMKYSCQDGSEGSSYVLTLGDQKLPGKIAEPTGTWFDHQIAQLGRVTMGKPGQQHLEIKPVQKPGQAVMNLVWIRLIPANQYETYLKQTAKERLQLKADLSHGVFIIPNFHPASCGWLADWSTERNYCGYSYLAHLDRVREDPTYAFVLSEVNNLMAIYAFEPQRIDEIKQRAAEGRMELVNAFFLESSISLSGGEALVKNGVEGLRWLKQVMNVRPRTAWMIDVCGVHEQMAQVVSGLGLDAFVYDRDNPTSSRAHWFESPDGTRVLAICADSYADWDDVFHTKEALSDKAMNELLSDAKVKARHTPAGLPVIVLGGYGDYSLPPARPSYPREFFNEWKQRNPDVPVRFATLTQYLDAILPAIRSGEAELPVARSGARFSFTAFWIENWPVKMRFRHAEHALQAAEAVSTAASLKTGSAYPVQPLYHAWLEMCLNMDRNTLWGSAAGKVFESLRSWDAKDRFDSVDAIAAQATQEAVRSMLGQGSCLGLFNAANWRRSDPVSLKLPAGKSLAGMVCQADADGSALCRLDLPPMSASGVELTEKQPEQPQAVPLPEKIENDFYVARIDPQNGALVSLTLKPSGREVLGGPVLMVAETAGDGDFAPARAKRKRLTDSKQFEAKITARQGPLATLVEAHAKFHGGGESCRTLRFYKDSPRIDFDVDYENIPNATIVLMDFPLANDIREMRRGVPYGFSHAAGSVPNEKLAGIPDGIQPAVRWSHYQMDGYGVALLDRGLSGREVIDRTPALFLLNAQDTYNGYPCAWLSGKGKQHGSFALVAHEGDFTNQHIPQMAWEYNAPPMMVEGVGKATTASFITTSENVIVEALRREGADIELRMAECFGVGGTATVKVSLPHEKAFTTDLTGANRKPLAGGPEYHIPVRPQQIVTLHFSTEKPVDTIQPLLKWDELVPPKKLEMLRKRMPTVKGHPPRGAGGPFPTLPADVSQSLTLGKAVTASGVFQGNAAFAPDLALDGDETTRWATNNGDQPAWLEVDLGRPEQIGRAYLSEAYDRLRRFELQYQKDGQWHTFAQGTRIGLNLEIRFEPVTAQHVRLSLPEAIEGPTLWEFHLFKP